MTAKARAPFVVKKRPFKLWLLNIHGRFWAA